MNWEYVLQQTLALVLGTPSGLVVGHFMWRGRRHGLNQ